MGKLTRSLAGTALAELVAASICAQPPADPLRAGFLNPPPDAELIRENYLAPITAFAESHHTLFRSQTYGDPAVTLADEVTPNLI